MKRVVYFPYLTLVMFLLFLLSLPTAVTDRVRGCGVTLCSPCWDGVNQLKQLVLAKIRVTGPSASLEKEVERVAQENMLLREQIESMRQWLLREDRLEEQMAQLSALRGAQRGGTGEFFKRRGEELAELLHLQMRSLPARVIFREPSYWSSTFWINIGKRHHVAKNSPVLVGTSVVGVVEYVDTSRSRVRLITDARLTPSVRAVRGKEQNRYLLEHIDSLLFALQVREDFPLALAEEAGEKLGAVRHQLLQQTGNLYLAKGVLQGSSRPLWRARSDRLRGVGFNYDFPDKEGPGYDLRSGVRLSSEEKALPILCRGDLLVTTGLDAIFPAGLRVAVVVDVKPLKEGASSYEIEAIPSVGSLDEIQHVLVLPPVSSE